MKTVNYSIALALLMIGMFGCASSQYMTPDPNFGNVKVEIKTIIGTDSIVKTPHGEIVGKIDKEGNIRGIDGVVIGKRKLTEAELIRQAGL